MLAPWLHEIQNQLGQARSLNRLHHAIMLYGAAGAGKALLATVVANALLCEVPGHLNPCGQCKSCLLIKAGSHPDKLEIGLDGQTIGVDEIRDVSTFVNHSAQQGGNKVVLILNAQKMTTAAANALLKTLEEPNVGRYLVISCSDLSLLPATIASRCFKTEVYASDGLAWLRKQGLVVSEHPWLAQFEQRPYLVLDWFDNNMQDDVDFLFNQASSHSQQWQVQEISALLTKRSELVAVFCQFLMANLSHEDKRDDYFDLSRRLEAVLAFSEKIKTVVGTNILLSLLHLQNRLG